MAQDIIVLSDNEEYNPSWDYISAKFPHAKHLTIDNTNNIKQILNLVNTSQFWVVFPGMLIKDFNFDLTLDDYEKNVVNLFKPINDNNKYSVCLVNRKVITKINSIYDIFSQPIKIHQQKVGVFIFGIDIRDFCIIFISYGELNAEKHYTKLLEKYGLRVKRVDGIKGIVNAHKQAAALSDTEHFYVIDADAEIVDSFNFDYNKTHLVDNNYVHIWYSLNPINRLTYGNGGVKLFNKSMFRYVSEGYSNSMIDMSTSISRGIKIIPEVSCITRFNTDPFSTWRSAFRECVKLSSNIIDGHIAKENEQRLKTWMFVADTESDFPEYCMSGACQGASYGKEHKDNREELQKINDFEWLKQRFTDYFGF